MTTLDLMPQLGPAVGARLGLVLESLSGGRLVALSVGSWLTGVGFIVAAVGLWVMSCRAYPYTACPKCDALGRVKDPSGRNWRTCAHCGGTGQRLRPGAHLFGARNRGLGHRRGGDPDRHVRKRGNGGSR